MGNKFSDMNLPRFPLLSDKEMQDLLMRAQAGDEAARERIVNCNLRLVFNLVQRFAGRGYETEDLFQIGAIGLIKAIDKFDLSYGVKFSTYAVPMIIGEIRRFLRDDNPIKVSRSLKEQGVKVRKCQEMLQRELGREPRISEVAAALDITVDEVTAAIEANRTLTSIHEAIYQEDGDPIYVIDQLADQRQAENRVFENLALKEVLDKLPERERRILLMRFFQDRTQTEVAGEIGISQVQVSRLERGALKKIRELME